MYVIKRAGKRERFDERKVHKSAFNACLGAELDVETAEKISQDVVNEVRKLTKGKKEVKSDVIFSRVKKILAKHNKECAFMYETYRDVS